MAEKIAFVADFFVNEIRGGGEIYDDILMSLFATDGTPVVKFKANELTNKHIKLYRNCGFHFIISNFCNLNVQEKEEFTKFPNSYSILEHDHKYIVDRNPANYKDFKVPSNRIINRQFYASAHKIFAQSKIHANVIAQNLNISNVVNLGMNLWSDEQITILKKYSSTEKNGKAAVINSSNVIKNTAGAVEFCQEKNIEYDLIGSSEYEEFIRQLAAYDKLVFFPRVLESFNRVVLEARMLNCRLITNSWNGCTSEDWFKDYKGLPLIEFVEDQREKVFNKIKEHLNARRHSKKTTSSNGAHSDITVILNAYRRPYNLQMQIDAIRNQTHPPKQIWLWVNAHEENKDFDFGSLDIDRLFHNDYNWKFYGRFAAALLADTEYVALYDDDTIPGSRWHENCLQTMKTHPGILGSAGIILNGNRYIQHERCGWPSQNPEITEVDLVGHSWFFKREWLRYLWKEKPVTWDNGEDIQFAFMCKIHGNIPTYCPAHPPDEKELHGSILGNELGVDVKATSTNATISHQEFFAQRDICVQTGLRNGWETIRGVKL